MDDESGESTDEDDVIDVWKRWVRVWKTGMRLTQWNTDASERQRIRANVGRNSNKQSLSHIIGEGFVVFGRTRPASRQCMKMPLITMQSW